MLNTEAERLFWDNCNYNSNMSRQKSKPKQRGIIRIVKPEVVLHKLEKMGVEITHRTLQRYAEEGLIPKPDTKAAGRGKGKITEYPEETPFQAYASWLLLKGNLRRSKKEVKRIREMALGLSKYPEDVLEEYYMHAWKAYSQDPDTIEVAEGPIDYNDPQFLRIREKLLNSKIFNRK